MKDFYITFGQTSNDDNAVTVLLTSDFLRDLLAAEVPGGLDFEFRSAIRQVLSKAEE